MSNGKLCPCGSQKELEQCCLPIIKNRQEAPTAERLMRARYSAFALGEIDFIISSHHSETATGIDRGYIAKWSKESEWNGLEIVKTENGLEADETGRVIFHAFYRRDRESISHSENAFFKKENNSWKFYDSEPLTNAPIVNKDPPIGRNDPCRCGSGKKFKKCCGR